ncbi:MAG: DAK2 domain-containing protein [Bacillota bacterium]
MQKTINCQTFRKMFVSGVQNLENCKAKVDSLNVFPVPDGDTGTNMSLTMMASVTALGNVAGTDFASMADTISNGALRGARGNSGVITSQIFKGFCGALKKETEINSKVLARAFGMGTEIAYQAVAKPQEGTILTVVRMMAEFAASNFKKYPNLEEFLSAIIDAGQVSLDNTPEILPVLKKAGVVDAGGYGLLVFFRGMLSALQGHEIALQEKSNEPESDFDKVREHADFTNLGDIEFAYCTEFFIVNMKKKTTQADIDRFRDKLLEMGDSLVVVGDLEFVKVHVHTNQPGKALSMALELGELDKLKIENMLEQNRQLLERYQAEKKDMGMLSICAGKGLSQIFKELAVDRIIEGGQTMNPSANDILEACKRINADNIFVFPNNKNIILAAEQAKALLEDKTLYVIPTRNIPQGIAAAIAFNPDVDAQENTENMLSAIKEVTVGQVTYAVRKTSLDGFDLNEGDIIGLDDKKIISMSSSKTDGVVEATKQVVNILQNEDHEILTLYFGEDVKKEEAEELAEKLEEEFPHLEVSAYYGGQPLYYYLISLE